MKKFFNKIIRRLHDFDKYDFDRLLDLVGFIAFLFIIYEIISYVHNENPYIFLIGLCVIAFCSLCYGAYYFGKSFLFESKKVRMNKY